MPNAIDISHVARVDLAVLPTPLESAQRLATALGLSHLWLKRDDNTGLALGGNKARKLEFLVGEAIEWEADTLVTLGGPQSNHCRMTAAAAAKFGLAAHLVFIGDETDRSEGNLRLDEILGAQWEFVRDRESGLAALDRVRDELRESGRRPYVIPAGGMNGRGTLGYVHAAVEMSEQFRDLPVVPRYVYASAGSCGTVAGLALGFALLDVECEVVGVSPSTDLPNKQEIIAQLIEEASDLLRVDVPRWSVRVLDDYVGDGYGRPTEAASRALELVARTEGVILDPVYTAKAFAGLIGDINHGVVGADDAVVFLHTGGAPALFATTDLYWPVQRDA